MRKCVTCQVSSLKMEFIGDKCIECYAGENEVEIPKEIIESKIKYKLCGCGSKINKRNKSSKCRACLYLLIRSLVATRKPTKIYLKKHDAE